MNTYSGVPISEAKLIVNIIIFSVMFILLLAVLGFWIYSIISSKDKTAQQHLKKLREKAQSDAIAKKKLEKIERRKKREKKKNAHNIIFDAVVMGLCTILSIAILVFCIIPATTDYVKKDYVVYTGKLEVCDFITEPYINLDDGTQVWGKAYFDEGDSYGTVVYSKRTRRLLGSRD